MSQILFTKGSRAIGIKAIFFCILFFLLISFSKAVAITSIKTGAWSATTTWDSGKIPGPNDDVTISNSKTVTINQGETFVVKSVTIAGKLIVNGTLTINGDLSTDIDGVLDMGPQSVLIVKGNIQLNNKAVLDLSSYLIVYGNIIKSGSETKGSISVNEAHIYVLGDQSSTPYDYFTICNNYGGSTVNTSASCDAGNFDALITNETTNTNTTISTVVQQIIEQKAIDVNNLSSNSSCICSGGNVTLTIGDSNTPINVDVIKWFKETTLVSNVTAPQKPYNLVTSQTGTYYALYKIGSIWYQTNSVTIASVQPPTASISGNSNICIGSSATLSITLTGQSPWNFTYTDGTTPVTVSNYSGANPYTINVSPVSTKTYTLTNVSNGCCIGTTSGSATVTVLTANVSITGQSTVGQTVCLGTAFNPISVTATASSGSISGYQWYKNTENNNSGGTSISGATSSSYTPDSSAPGTWFYYCVVSGGCGTVTSGVSEAMTVKTNNTADSPSSTPTLCINTALTPITIATTGATGIGTATGLPSGVNAIWASDRITISGTPTEIGTFNYSIPLIGGCGNVNATGTITVNSSTAITSQSTDGQTQCINGTFTAISVTSSEIGTPLFQWYSNIVAEKTGGSLISGATSASYIPQATTVGTLYYYCVVTGTCGTATSAVSGPFVTNDATSITSQSTDGQTQCINGTFTAISVTASGTGTLTYQWYSNTTASNTGGTSLGSANGAQTASYIPQATTAGTSYYYCVVTGSCGTATSEVSGATIVFPSFDAGVISSAGEEICYNGDPGIIGSSIAASGGDGNITYKWQANGVDIASSNSETYDPPAGLTSNTTYTRWAKVNECNTTFVLSAGSWSVIVKPLSMAPSSITGTNSICNGGETTLSVSGGSLDSGASWKWYSGWCGGTLIGTGSSITVSPTITTTYYVRAEGTCNATSCTSIEVIVSPSNTISEPVSSAFCATSASSDITMIGSDMGSEAYLNT